MPIEMVLSLKCIEEIKSIDSKLKIIALHYQLDINLVREVAETCHEMNYFDDEEGELQKQLEQIEIAPDVFEEIKQLVNTLL
ncbi:MAG: hypothetical protein K2G70_03515 [Turicibacter sp.]|nr:hypothetical protein [Turicibacter sp.]